MESKKRIFSDSIWSIAGLVLMNVALQFAVYPFWERRLGSDGLGDILYLISLMNVFSVSMGVSVNYARMRKSATVKTRNMPYIVVLLCASLIALDIGFVIALLGGVDMSFLEVFLFALVMCATMWRYYADVEYKLYLNYKKFFVYYAFVSVGYLLGIVLFFLTGLWPITLLTGELFGLAYVYMRGRIFRIDDEPFTPELHSVARLVLVLFGSEAMATLIFNADRIMLKGLLGSVAVADYYLASLLGKTVALLTVPLSGVIIGYLAKYKGVLSLKGMNIIMALSGGAIVLGTAACTVGSYIVIPIIYPDQFEAVKSYFVLANLAQVIYFVANVITVILLRFARSKYQIYVNAAYAVSFAAICIPSAIKGGFDGFCIGLAVTCVIRLLVSAGLGYYTVIFKKKASAKPAEQ